MAQNPGGSSSYHCDPFANKACLPDAFLDASTGGFWVKIAELDATCDDGIPNGAPIRENPWDDESSWVAVNPSGGGGGQVIRDPFIPTNETTPIDYGMPIDLTPMDAFAWEMANRIGPDVYLTSAEIEFLSENWDFTYDFRDYVSLNNIKPDLGKNLDGWFYDKNDFQNYKIPLKVVGRDSYNEETDYRLYERECKAYTFLFDKANSSGQEYGAYITTKGIIVLPANKAQLTPDGTRAIEFLIWKMSKTSSREIVPTNQGTRLLAKLCHR
ncbi:hypothetical protein [Spirosoma endbachense]|uniref:Uncharacterized protein n=1 Tax=Spirosoma endbachense TaxID=2666025 RepID=A0A6P1VW22_9BACT|nr:hypothetical protein [Spirosoma endbachense]QHV96568.1 hypothetical protein GJR95_16790 [Spirosoma endbachense]